MPYRVDPVWQDKRNKETDLIVEYLYIDEMPTNLKNILVKLNLQELQLLINAVRNATEAFMIN